MSARILSTDRDTSCAPISPYQPAVRRRRRSSMRFTRDRRNFYVGASLCVLVVALGVGQAVLQNKAEAQARASVQAPMFEVDPLWPKPLPNHWLLGMTIGVWVDDQDHVWIIHRGGPTLHANERALELKVGECCASA